MIFNHNSDIIAIVSYKRVGQRRSINFFSNKNLEKIYINGTEHQITNTYRELVQIIE